MAAPEGSRAAFEVPTDAKNPIEIGFRGANAAELVDLVVQACGQIPIGAGCIDREEGYVETDWIDLGMFEIGWVTHLTVSGTPCSTRSQRTDPASPSLHGAKGSTPTTRYQNGKLAR